MSVIIVPFMELYCRRKNWLTQSPKSGHIEQSSDLT